MKLSQDGKTVTLQINVTLSEAGYAELRVYFSEKEIKNFIEEEGLDQLLDWLERQNGTAE